MDHGDRQLVGNQLSPREVEILRLMAEGLSNKAIAEQLFIGFETVKWYLKQMYGKLHVSSRTQAIAVARSLRLLDDTQAKVNVAAQLHNLPVQTTPFVGREAELAEIARLLCDPMIRLVTILGPGGIGKTRLSLEASTVQLSRFRDGVYFVALAPLSDPGLIPAAIAEALQLSFAPGESPRNQLLRHLSNKHSLLVLDNIEHLLAGIDFISELLQGASRVVLLVTSRERLQLQSEVVFRIEGLPFMEWSTPEEAAKSGAGRLFLQSAWRVSPSFALSAKTMHDLSAICRLVNGIPLAILLAAAWIDSLTITEISQEIQRSFEFLEGELHDLPERQRSLRAVFAQSWMRLSEAERSAMRSVSVFRGGFTREAVEQVGGISLKTLIGLVNKSLLNRDPSGRFDVHELLRQYSEKELDQLVEERERVHSRQADYYATFMDKRWEPIRSTRTNETVIEIEVEIDNVRAAWDVMVEHTLLPQLAKTARVLWYFLQLQGLYQEGIDRFGRVAGQLRMLPASEARDKMLGEVLQRLGYLYASVIMPDIGKRLAEESLTILKVYDADELIVEAYMALLLSQHLLSEWEAMNPYIQRGIAVAQRLSDPWYKFIPVYFGGLAALSLGEYAEAYRAGKEALRFAEEAGDPHFQAWCYGLLLGQTAMRIGHYEEAKHYYLRNISLSESIREYYYVALASQQLSEVLALLHEFDATRKAYQDSLRYFAQFGPKGLRNANLRSVSRLFEIQGEYTKAVEILALLMHHQATALSDLPLAQVSLTRLRGYLSSEDFSAAYERGKVLDLEAVIAELLQDA